MSDNGQWRLVESWELLAPGNWVTLIDDASCIGIYGDCFDTAAANVRFLCFFYFRLLLFLAPLIFCLRLPVGWTNPQSGNGRDWAKTIEMQKRLPAMLLRLVSLFCLPTAITYRERTKWNDPYFILLRWTLTLTLAVLASIHRSWTTTATGITYGLILLAIHRTSGNGNNGNRCSVDQTISALLAVEGPSPGIGERPTKNEPRTRDDRPIAVTSQSRPN